MANGIWEEAKACPKCGLTGEQSRSTTAIRPQAGVTRGARLVKFTCKNRRCKWYDTSWEVQINPDGTIPDPNAPREKQFKKVDPALAEQMRQRAMSIQDATTRGGEIRR